MSNSDWPSLPYKDWKDTLDTLHLWMQIVGKVKLALSPFINQWWQVAFYVTPRGITTGRIPYGDLAFQIIFDFISHQLIIQTSTGQEKFILLRPLTVTDFYEEFMSTLSSLGVKILITPTPSEIPNPIPFEKDTIHSSYDKEFAQKWWRIVLKVSFVFDKFRTNFRGKSSPVQFFWGSFDLNTTRFSGKKLPDKTDWPKGYSFMRYAENEENFAIGFWPGDPRFPYPAFYSYLYPNTDPSIPYFNKTLSECILFYEEIRSVSNPEKEIMNFLNTTYIESAKIAHWNIKELEGIVPKK